MTGIRRILTSLGLWAALVLTGAAQTVPQGYTTSTANGVWVATSPDQGSGARVKVYFYPVESTSENFARWFAARSAANAKKFGTITQTHGEPEETYESPKAPVRYHLMSVTSPARQALYVETYGYDTSEGLQLVQLVSHVSIASTNAAYQNAVAGFLADWGNGVYYQPPAQPADTAIPPPPAGKKNCRREPVWGWAVRYGCSPSAVCNERVIKRYEWVCDR